MIGQFVSVFGDVISHVNISSVRAEDGGEYECIADNRAGTDRHSARLNVYGKLILVQFLHPSPCADTFYETYITWRYAAVLSEEKR
jgi:hypothetical protein